MDSLKLENVINNPYLLSIYDQVANQTIMPWSYFLPVFGILYLLFCRALRYRRRDSLLKKYNYPTRESLAKMTNDEAQVIGKALGQLEFPYIYTTSLQFALFKVSYYEYPYQSMICLLLPYSEYRVELSQLTDI